MMLCTNYVMKLWRHVWKNIALLFQLGVASFPSQVVIIEFGIIACASKSHSLVIFALASCLWVCPMTVKNTCVGIVIVLVTFQVNAKMSCVLIVMSLAINRVTVVSLSAVVFVRRVKNILPVAARFPGISVLPCLRLLPIVVFLFLI